MPRRFKTIYQSKPLILSLAGGLLLVFCCRTGLRADEPGNGIKAVAAAVIDDRYWVPERTSGSRLKVQMLLRGEALAGATAYANLRIDRALDELSNDLSPHDQALRSNIGMRLIARHPQNPDQAPSVLVEFFLGSSSRTASRIVSISGQV